MEAVFHVFPFLRHKYNWGVVLDPTYTTMKKNDFKEFKWKGFYGKIKEAIPPNAPEKRGKGFYLRGYVDGNHA